MFKKYRFSKDHQSYATWATIGSDTGERLQSLKLAFQIPTFYSHPSGSEWRYLKRDRGMYDPTNTFTRGRKMVNCIGVDYIFLHWYFFFLGRWTGFGNLYILYLNKNSLYFFNNFKEYFLKNFLHNSQMGNIKITLEFHSNSF